MANKHFGNLADVFKHLALAEVLGAVRPGEYWESHAGSAYYTEGAADDGAAQIAEERSHGVHGFLRVAAKVEGLRLSYYCRMLSAARATSAADGGPRIPGSPLVARMVLGEEVRRMLFCDLDAESLVTIRDALPNAGGKRMDPEKIECVQDDGLSVLRGAAMLLPDQWAASTVVFLDPWDAHAPTAAGISPMELACEMANRSIATMLFYTFDDDAGRVRQQERFSAALEKARLLRHGVYRLEGALKNHDERPVPTQWGFGLLTLHVRNEVLEKVDQKLQLLEAAYSGMELAGKAGAGEWRYVRGGM